MSTWSHLLKSRRRREAERARRRRQALTKARTAVRRERRSVAKRQAKAEEMRRKAVVYERQGKPGLAKQMVRQLVQIDKEAVARTLAVNNMEYTLEQVQVKDNYDEFVRGMEVVARIEELARESVDPDEVRERLTELAQRNQDLVEPWTETSLVDVAAPASSAALDEEEQDAYAQVVNEAAGAIEGDAADGQEAGLARMDADLERKMDEALA